MNGSSVETFVKPRRRVPVSLSDGVKRKDLVLDLYMRDTSNGVHGPRHDSGEGTRGDFRAPFTTEVRVRQLLCWYPLLGTRGGRKNREACRGSVY